MSKRIFSALRKCSVLIVQIKKVLFLIIVGDKDIWPAIVVNITDVNTQPELYSSAMDTCLLTYLCKVIPRFRCRTYRYNRVIPIEPIAKLRMPGVSELICIDKRRIVMITVIDKKHIEIAI